MKRKAEEEEGFESKRLKLVSPVVNTVNTLSIEELDIVIEQASKRRAALYSVHCAEVVECVPNDVWITIFNFCTAHTVPLCLY